jgi:hypothetical protein
MLLITLLHCTLAMTATNTTKQNTKLFTMLARDGICTNKRGVLSAVVKRRRYVTQISIYSNLRAINVTFFMVTLKKYNDFDEFSGVFCGSAVIETPRSAPVEQLESFIYSIYFNTNRRTDEQ